MSGTSLGKRPLQQSRHRGLAASNTTMKCAQCGAESPTGMRFCGNAARRSFQPAGRAARTTRPSTNSAGIAQAHLSAAHRQGCRRARRLLLPRSRGRRDWGSASFRAR